MYHGEQLRAARNLVRWSQHKLAQEAGISVETVKRLEAIRGPVSANTKTIDAIISALKPIVEFIDENGGGPGVRLRKRSS